MSDLGEVVTFPVRKGFVEKMVSVKSSRKWGSGALACDTLCLCYLIGNPKKF